MGKKSKNAKTFGKVEEYPYPSRYGSHISMLKEMVGEYAICEDDSGEYVTRASILDNGFSDSWRWSSKSFRDSVLSTFRETGRLPDDEY